MLKKLLILSLLFIGFISFTSQSQELKPEVNLLFNARADAYIHSSENSTTSGFQGKNLNIMLNGKLNDRFSFNIRQRLNKYVSEELGYFNATDMAYLTYQINKKFSVSVGKQVVAIGGYEYDYAPINIYFLSDFTNNIPSSYEFGASINYITEKNNFGFQVTNSPFAINRNSGDGTYAYNIMWMGAYKTFNSLYSINFMEYTKGKFLNYIALGNQFNVKDFTLEFDFANRTSLDKVSFFEDFSIVGNLMYSFNKQWNAFIKGGYDQNKSDIDTRMQSAGAYAVALGTKYTFGGIGAEYYPLKNSKNIRIHAFAATTNNKTDKFLFDAGLTWLFKAL